MLEASLVTSTPEVYLQSVSRKKLNPSVSNILTLLSQLELHLSRRATEDWENKDNQMLPPFFLSTIASPKVDRICG